MKQRQTYTIPYPVSGFSIAKQRDSFQSILPTMKFLRKKSIAGMSRLLILAVAFFALNTTAYSQACPTSGTHTQSANENTYYPGTQATVNAGATSITLGAAGSGTDFGITPISVGDLVLIIQMQGAQINTTNSNIYGSGVATFQGSGFTSTNLMAGYMEFAVATNAVPLAGGTLNIASGTVRSYATSAYGTWGQYTYQIIRVPSYYNIQLTAGITTPFWNGSSGGVTVISAVNQLDFNSKTINALGAGFRGGGGRKLSGASRTNNTDYVTIASLNANGSKAEGIAGTPQYLNNSYSSLINNGIEGYPNGSYARGAPGNAGGGATDYDPASNDQNSGGGGGGNGGTGGIGGWGWNLSGPSGGRGGLSFNATITPYAAYHSPSRLIMGGGGGAGTTNDGQGTPGNGLASSGAAGGGIVIINATAIIGTGTINVSGANGNSTVTNDASGGGGGGGSILIYANSGNSGITAIAYGGVGGTNNPKSVGATRHGPGGGGGGGVIYSNNVLNASSSVLGAVNGVSIGTDATTNFGATSGGNGILTQTFPFAQLPPKMQICQTILPVTLSNFNASYIAANNVRVIWSASQEINSAYYVVQRSTDASNFTDIGQVEASQSVDYNYNDYLGNVNSNVVYYRLKIVDKDGKINYSKIVSVYLGEPTTKISIYPNPASDFTVVNLYSDKQEEGVVKLMDDAGKQLLYRSFNINTGNNSLMIDRLANLPKGIYVVQVILSNTVYNEKLIKK